MDIDTLLAPDQRNRILERAARLPVEEQKELYKLLGKYEKLRKREKQQRKFLEFVRAMWPAFISGRHHAIIADAFERVAAGKLKRLIIALPPRHTKSEFGSFLFPAWFLGRYPNKKVIQIGNTAELAVGFGRRVRNLVSSEDYQKVFPGVALAADSKAAGRWDTNRGGQYFAIGVGGSVTGKGADCLIIDDPHTEQEAAMAVTNADVYDRTYEWYTSGPRQRLQPGGAIIVIATRWSKRDLTGRLLQRMEEEHSDEWEVIEFPAILPSGNALWPEFWPLDELLAVKASLPVAKWNAQYMQNPTSDENAIIKRDWWRIWEHPDPPKCEFIIQTWDTAHTKRSRSDPSACTTFGVFRPNPETEERNLILLNALSLKLEFPELKARAKEEWKQWNPDSLLIEAKAAGWPLIQELREMGIPVQDYSPSRGEDKFIRLNAMSDMFRSGMVWAPPYRWAEEVIEQVADFPNGDHDDLVDCVSLAGMRFRQGGFLRLPSDEADEKRASKQVIEYY